MSDYVQVGFEFPPEPPDDIEEGCDLEMCECEMCLRPCLCDDLETAPDGSGFLVCPFCQMDYYDCDECGNTYHEDDMDTTPDGDLLCFACYEKLVCERDYNPEEYEEEDEEE